MPKTLDRYIIRQFLGTFFLILVLIMSIAVVFDISEKTEDFAKTSASVKEIVVDYYVNFVIYYSNLFSGLLIFIAVLLFTSRLAGRTEVIAMLSSGVSYPRFVRPFMVTATILTALSLYVNIFLLPAANRTRLAFEKAHIWTTYNLEEKNVLREIAPGEIVYFEAVDMPKLTGYRFSLEKWEHGQLRSKLISDRAVYDTATGRWTVYDYMIREIPPDPGFAMLDQGLKPQAPVEQEVMPMEQIRRGPLLDTAIALKPSDLGQRLAIAAALDRTEIAAFIQAEKARGGSTVAYYEVEQKQRTSYPFATYVFTLMGVGIASRKVRGGTGVHMVLGVLLCLLYVFAMKMTTVAATNSAFNPTLAVWLPNILFGIIAVWIYWKAPK
ncbi:MAG: LptF/LptG family permease [Flavobacteriales bacterium]|nr:LptF/LptG family permease [Flavobacteriales bacterium]MBP9080804.1 LptF/LptG family permease [Flavobacteriales bacterium]